MPAFQTVRRVPFTPHQMFDLVADVERYPEFLPLCEGLAVLRRERGENPAVLVARMDVGYKSVRESFTTRVRLFPKDPQVLVEYLDGPFHHLENRWRFLPAPGGTDVDFHIAYEFRSRLIALVVGNLFDKAFRRFAAAFEDRARVVYGFPAVPAGGLAASLK